MTFYLGFMDNGTRRPTETASTVTDRLLSRLRDRNELSMAGHLDDLAGAVENLSAASMFDNGTRRRAQVVDAFTAAQVACLAALSRLVAQMDADMDVDDREGAADARDQAWVTSDAAVSR